MVGSSPPSPVLQKGENMHIIRLTPERSLTRAYRDDYRIEEVLIEVSHIEILEPIHENPEHPRGRGVFMFTKIGLTSGRKIYVKETPHEIRGLVMGN